QIAQQYADKITITSDNPRDEKPEAIINDAMKGFSDLDDVARITDRGRAIIEAIEGADASSVILIAGKGHETYKEVKSERHHFDELEVALEALNRVNGNTKSEEVA